MLVAPVWVTLTPWGELLGSLGETKQVIKNCAHESLKTASYTFHWDNSEADVAASKNITEKDVQFTHFNIQLQFFQRYNVTAPIICVTRYLELLVHKKVKGI